MGRHAAPVAADTVAPPDGNGWSPDNPVTDPHLFDSPLTARKATSPAPAPRPRPDLLERRGPGTAPRTVAPAARPAPHAANPVVTEHQRRVAPRPVAPQLPPMPRIASPYDQVPRFSDIPIAASPRLAATTLSTPPLPVHPLLPQRPLQEVPTSLGKRSTALAVCAVAVLGAVSTAAMVLPTSRTPAQAEGLSRGPVTHPMPVPTSGPAVALAKELSPHRREPWPPQSPAAARPTGQGQGQGQATVRAAPAPASATPGPFASATPTPSSGPTSGSTPTTGSTLAPSAHRSPSGLPTRTAPSGGGSLLQALSRLGGNAVLGSGTYTFRNFSGTLGAELPNSFSGQGENNTVLEMTPHSSNRAGLVPTRSGSTNPLIMLESQGGSPLLRNFTLQGTNQGHLYHGLRIKNAVNARIENVRVRAIPGNDKVNPGETFGIADFRSSGSTYSGVEVDGAGVGASGLGLNNSTNTTVRDSYFHDNPYSAGIAAWQSSNLTLTDVITKNNRTGLNFERVSGTVTIVRPTIQGNSAQDIYIGSDQGSAKITIIDPVFNGRLRIRIPANYWAGPERQRRSDVHVIINGVDRTSQVVQWL